MKRNYEVKTTGELLCIPKSLYPELLVEGALPDGVEKLLEEDVGKDRLIVVEVQGRVYVAIKGGRIKEFYVYTTPVGRKINGRRWLLLIREALDKANSAFALKGTYIFRHKSYNFPNYFTDTIVECTAIIRYNHGIVDELRRMLVSRGTRPRTIIQAS